jgi:hemolysin activation/secretion protein
MSLTQNSDRQFCVFGRFFRSLGVLWFLTYTNAIKAEPSAGLLQQIQGERSTLTVPQSVPEVDLSPVEEKKPVGLTFTVKQFELKGNKEISTEELQTLLKPWLNKPITFNDLEAATNALSEHYKAHGWLIRTVLPPQDITEGTVIIEINEAIFGGLKIENQSERISESRIENWIYSHLPRQGTLSLDDLDRAVLTLNDLPDVAVTSSLKEGDHPGETVLVVTVKDKPWFNGVLGSDNFGYASTGRARGTANVNVNGPLGIGDLLNGYGIGTEGTRYGRVNYSVPIGTDGLSVGVNAGYMPYSVISNSFRSLYAQGDSISTGAEVNYPVVRSRPVNLYFQSNYYYTLYNNTTRAGTTGQYFISVGGASLNGNVFDTFLEGAITSAAITVSGGDVNLNGSPNQASADAIGAHTAGGFAKARYTLSRQQNVTETIVAHVALMGQVANKNMNSAEQMYMGGPMGVRAYDPGQGASSQGNLVNAELRYILPWDLQAAAFYDFANVQTWVHSHFKGAAAYNSYDLQGAGAYFSWLGPYGIQARATWAHRVGGVPEVVNQSLANNGGNSPNRYWLSLSVPF